MRKNFVFVLIAYLQLLWINVQAQGQNKSTSQNLSLNKIQVEKPKNVVFILTDDHRYDFMGFTKKIALLQLIHILSPLTSCCRRNKGQKAL